MQIITGHSIDRRRTLIFEDSMEWRGRVRRRWIGHRRVFFAKDVAKTL